MALPARDHRISLTDAAALTRAYREATTSDVKAGAIAKDPVLQLLNQTGGVGWPCPPLCATANPLNG